LASGVIFGFFIESGYSATVMVVFALVLQAIAIVLLSKSKQTFQECSPLLTQQ